MVIPISFMVTMKAHDFSLVTIGARLLLKSAENIFTATSNLRWENNDFYAFPHLSFIFIERKASPMLRSPVTMAND